MWNKKYILSCLQYNNFIVLNLNTKIIIILSLVHPVRQKHPKAVSYSDKLKRESSEERIMTTLKVYADRMSQPSRAIIIFLK